MGNNFILTVYGVASLIFTECNFPKLTTNATKTDFFHKEEMFVISPLDILILRYFLNKCLECYVRFDMIASVSLCF